jgi:uncharacterized protein (DUF2147 family)
MRLGSFAVASVMAAALAAPALAQPSVEGIYRNPKGDAHYEVTLCGSGEQLCARMVWHSDDVGPRTRSMLGKLIIDRIRPDGANRWKGSVNFGGDNISGTVRFLGDTIEVRGCTFVVLCDDVIMTRVDG